MAGTTTFGKMPMLPLAVIVHIRSPRNPDIPTTDTWVLPCSISWDYIGTSPEIGVP